jgi:hypothetical protein
VQVQPEPTSDIAVHTSILSLSSMEKPISGLSEAIVAEDNATQEFEPKHADKADHHITQEAVGYVEGDNLEDEETSRKRHIADKLMKMGGVNPFAPGGPRSPPLAARSPPLRQASGGSVASLPARKASTSSVISSQAEEQVRIPPPPLRRDTRPRDEEQGEATRSAPMKSSGVEGTSENGN